MTQSLRMALSLLLLGVAVWHSPGAFAETDCEQARADYDRALQQTDPAQVLALLDGVVARCPSFNAWFVKGQAHRMLEQWDQALEAYRQAHGRAGKPESGWKAEAYGALMQHRLGRTCKASREFRQLRGADPDAPLPSWLREPYEAFERSLVEKPMTADEMACALRVTADDKALGVCPRLNVRIPFAYDRADVDGRNRSKVEELAEVLHRVHDDVQRYRLVGHTDSRGRADYNQGLSQRRAQSVRAFILERQQGLQGRLEAGGEGENRLLATDDAESSHAPQPPGGGSGPVPGRLRTRPRWHETEEPDMHAAEIPTDYREASMKAYLGGFVLALVLAIWLQPTEATLARVGTGVKNVHVLAIGSDYSSSRIPIKGGARCTGSGGRLQDRHRIDTRDGRGHRSGKSTGYQGCDFAGRG